MDLRMTIGESVPAGAVMVAGREIDHLFDHHVHGKIAVINAVRAFIQKHHGLRRRGQRDIRGLAEGAEDLIPRRSVWSHPATHRDAAHSRQEQGALTSKALVSDALISACALDEIRTKLGIVRIQQKYDISVVARGGFTNWLEPTA